LADKGQRAEDRKVYRVLERNRGWPDHVVKSVELQNTERFLERVRENLPAAERKIFERLLAEEQAKTTPKEE
jgi:hypothetical protein